jgi:hypothetical protein
MGSVAYSRRNGVVTVTADDGTVQEWPIAEFDADPAAFIAATGNGINPPVPESVTAPQARVALLRAGLLPWVEAMVAQLGSNSELAIFWEYSVTYGRQHPMLLQMAAGLELSDGQVDDLFRAAAAITA